MERMEHKEHKEHGQETFQGESKARWLQDRGYLGEFTTKECQDFIKLLNHIHMADGEALFEQGERGDQVFFIHQGQVDMGVKGAHSRWVDFGPYGSVNMDDDQPESGSWISRVTLAAGECVGETDFVMDASHSLSARAVGEVDLLCLGAGQLRHLAKENPHLCRCLSENLVRSLRSVSYRCCA